LARAKNTNRAEARRRTREQQRAAEGTLDQLDDEGPDATTVEQPQAAGLRGMFKMPNIRDDLRTFPRLLVHTPKLWIPFGMLVVSFILAVLLSQTTTNADGTTTSSVFPSGIEGIVSLYVELTLPPTALFVFFIGGFLAPRSSYLVGATLGLLDGILWSLLFVISPAAQPTATGRLVQPADFVAIVLVAVVVGILAAAFASWYRNFLRSSQERARQNRAARDQQQKMKAKEDARAARDAQRQTSSASRQTKNVTTPPKPNTLTTTPPKSNTLTTPPSKR
jgi:xanthosine utilization system XapX-like protein